MYIALIVKAVIAVILIALVVMLVNGIWTSVETTFNTLVFG